MGTSSLKSVVKSYTKPSWDMLKREKVSSKQEFPGRENSLGASGFANNSLGTSIRALTAILRGSFTSKRMRCVF